MIAVEWWVFTEKKRMNNGYLQIYDKTDETATYYSFVLNVGFVKQHIPTHLPVSNYFFILKNKVQISVANNSEVYVFLIEIYSSWEMVY